MNNMTDAILPLPPSVATGTSYISVTYDSLKGLRATIFDLNSRSNLYAKNIHLPEDFSPCTHTVVDHRYDSKAHSIVITIGENKRISHEPRESREPHECPVCLESIHGQDEVFACANDHITCRSCVHQMIRQNELNVRCPLCREETLYRTIM